MIKITLVGFFIVISPHIALYFISTPIENFVLGVPSVLSIMQAVCIFVYAVHSTSTRSWTTAMASKQERSMPVLR